MQATQHRAVILLTALFLLCALGAGCSSCGGAQASTETKGVEQLRALTRTGRPDETALAQLEKEYPNSRVAGLARLAQVRARMAAGDWATAATLLDDKVVERADLAEYVTLWKAKTRVQTNQRAEAEKFYADYADDYADSFLARDAAIVRGENLLADGKFPETVAALKDLAAKNDGSALALTAQAYLKSGDNTNADSTYRRLYFYAPAHEATQAWFAQKGLVPVAANATEAYALADGWFTAKRYKEAADAYAKAVAQFPSDITPAQQFQRGLAAANQKRWPEASTAFNAVANERRAEALYELAQAYGKNRLWAQAGTTVAEMRRSFPKDKWTNRALVAIGTSALEAKNSGEAQNYFSAAVATFPKQAETAPAHFNLAWMAHEQKNYASSAQLFIEHVADYSDKNSDFRGRAGYWAARDSEQAGDKATAAALYNALQNRYAAHWYGYLAKQRLAALGANAGTQALAADSLAGRAAANLKIVTVIATPDGDEAAHRWARAEALDLIGEKELALTELNQGLRQTPQSLKLNLAVAKIYRTRKQNLAAFLALRKIYPDYAQMAPEEMTPEEWDVFYPLDYWEQITSWAKSRNNLDPYHVAGVIRQESVFDPTVKSSANAYGLMQLLLPTARGMAQRYNAQSPVNETTIYQPALNIELGTAYMRDMFNKFGRVEYVAAAYNAGPGRVPTWRATLPPELDDWVEAIPFKETRGYVQGVVRNILQYKRLYDTNGQFRAEVGSRATQPDATVRVRRADEE